MTELDIQQTLWLHHKEPDYLSCFNSMHFGWEMDMCVLDMSTGHVTEFEIKRTSYDFKKDFKKYKHGFFKSKYAFQSLRGGYGPNYKAQFKNGYFPNNFCFVCEEGVINPGMIPDYCGLVYVYKNRQVQVVKSCPLLHSKDLRITKLFRSFAKHLSKRKDINYSP